MDNKIDPAELKRRYEGMLHAFEAVKANAENAIFTLKKDLADLEGSVEIYQIPIPTKPQIDLEDPDVLGIDSIGRVIKRRKLSAEVIEKKRKLMREIRDQRLKDIEELKKLRAEKAEQESKLKSSFVTVVPGKKK